MNAPSSIKGNVVYKIYMKSVYLASSNIKLTQYKAATGYVDRTPFSNNNYIYCIICHIKYISLYLCTYILNKYK